MTKEGNTEEKILFGKYRLLHKLGTGWTGTVWLTLHLSLEEYRAIKCVPRTCAGYEIFRREALILKELQHPGIPMIYDPEEDPEYSYLIEEYLQGHSLYTLIKCQGTLKQTDAVRYGMQICGLVEYMHSACKQPILYLDLQPYNLIICNGTVKLIDFDHAASCLDVNQEEQRYGTAGCAAPEQYTSDGILDQGTDVYATGAVLRFMLTGTLKQGVFAPQMVTEPLQSIIEKCMGPNMDRRYENAKELNSVLRRLCIRELTVNNDHRAGPSLIINLAGVRPGAGIIHLSLGLLHFLTIQGYEVLYEEHNRSQAVRILAWQVNAWPDRRGIYSVNGCFMKPWYGPAVRLEEPLDFSVVLKDYGTDWKILLEESARDYVLVTAVTDSAWEACYIQRAVSTLMDQQNLCKGKKAVFIFRHAEQGYSGRRLHIRDWNGLLKQSLLYRSSEYRDPFSRDRSTQLFFRSLWDGISGEVGTGRSKRGWLKGWDTAKGAILKAAGTLRPGAGSSESSEREGGRG